MSNKITGIASKFVIINCNFSIISTFRQLANVGKMFENIDIAILTSFLYTPEVGDIVAIDAEQQIGKTIIKRVIATEGQTIKIDYDKNRVIVDGIVIDEDYVASPTIMPTIGWDVPETVPEGYVFVMGDNRSVSLDSRSGSIQLIPKTMILGKAQFVIYPFEHFKYLY